MEGENGVVRLARAGEARGVFGAGPRRWRAVGQRRERARAPGPMNEGGLIVRYITHEFAHPETLDRAHRWLIQTGMDPSRIEVSHQGVPRLAVLATTGEAAVVELVVGAAVTSDAEGLPGFWGHGPHHRKDVHAPARPAPAPAPSAASRAGRHGDSFMVRWQPIDLELEVARASTASDVDLRRALVERWD